MINTHEIPNKPGIYMLINKVNGKIYIGKSNQLRPRMVGHKTAAKKRKNKCPISKAINKHGWDNFEIEVLAEFDYTDTMELLALETAFINFYNATSKDIGYNICLFSNDTTGYKASVDTKRKMSLAGKGKKKNFSPKYLQILKDRIKNIPTDGKNNPMYGKKMTTEHLAKFINGRIEKCSKQVAQLDKDSGRIIKIWWSMSEAVRFLKKNRSYIGHISNACKTNRMSLGYKWSETTREEYQQFKIENPHLYKIGEGVSIKDNNSEHQRNPAPDLSISIS